MNSIPETKVDELGQKINQLLSDAYQSNRLTDELSWLRCMKDAEKLKGLQEFAADAYGMEGVLFALKANREKSFAAFEKAIKLNASNTLILLNHVNCALMLGKPMLAAKIIAELSEQFDGDPEVLYRLFSQSFPFCMFKTAEKMLSKLEKLNKTELVSKSLINNAIEAFTFLNKHQFNEQDIADRLDVASNIVFELSGVPLYAFKICATHAGLIYEFILSLPVNKLVEIDWAIAEALTEKFDNPMANLISFSTTTFTPQKS